MGRLNRSDNTTLQNIGETLRRKEKKEKTHAIFSSLFPTYGRSGATPWGKFTKNRRAYLSLVTVRNR